MEFLFYMPFSFLWQLQNKGKNTAVTKVLNVLYHKYITEYELRILTQSYILHIKYFFVWKHFHIAWVCVCIIVWTCWICVLVLIAFQFSCESLGDRVYLLHGQAVTVEFSHKTGRQHAGILNYVVYEKYLKPVLHAKFGDDRRQLETKSFAPKTNFPFPRKIGFLTLSKISPRAQNIHAAAIIGNYYNWKIKCTRSIYWWN